MMKKFILLLVCLVGLCGQAAAQDYLLLENLIKGHKEISDKLRARTGIEASALASHMILEDADKAYQLVTDTLSWRMSSSMTDAAFLSDVARLTLNAQVAVKIADKAYDKALDLIVDFPFLCYRAERAAIGITERISEIYRLPDMVLSNGLKVSLGTPQLRHVYLRMVDQRIYWIVNEFRDMYNFCCVVESTYNRGGSMSVDYSNEAILQRAKQNIDRMNTRF